MRIAKWSLVLLFVSLLFVSQAAFAQIGVQTAQPVSTTPTTASLNVSTTSTATPECDVNTGWLPLKGKTPADALCFWNQGGQEYLKYARFISTSKTMSASTEMITDWYSDDAIPGNGGAITLVMGD